MDIFCHQSLEFHLQMLAVAGATIMRKTTTGRMTKVVLLISFIILVGRLLYAAIAAIPHHQEKRSLPEPQTQEARVDNR